MMIINNNFQYLLSTSSFVKLGKKKKKPINELNIGVCTFLCYSSAYGPHLQMAHTIKRSHVIWCHGH